MLRKTMDYMKQHQMIAPGEKIVLGLSGGMDSVCLFYLLKELGFCIEAVHVHHGIRGEEADRDERFAQNLCRENQVSYHKFFFDVPKICKEYHLSVEEAGRAVRKEAFREVMEKTGASKIALAHHGNDRAETFLFHLSRGSGVKGLSSMRPVQGEIIRPILWASKREIENFVAEKGYKFVEDSTNHSVEYTRNKLRMEVIPLLEEVNPKAVAHICKAAEKLNAAASYIDREAEKLCRLSCVMYQKEVQILKFAFFQGDEVLYVPVLQKCVEYLSQSLANITEEHLLSLLALFSMQTGKEVQLPGGVCAVRTYDGIRMFLREEKVMADPVEITGEGTYLFGGITVKVSIEPWDERKIFPIKTYTKCFDYDKIKSNVFLRTREVGDFLEINKDHGKKSLQDYLVNEKVPKDDRDQVMLLACEHHILWVIGKRISEYYKVTKETKRVLKVQVCGGNIYE